METKAQIKIRKIEFSALTDEGFIPQPPPVPVL